MPSLAELPDLKGFFSYSRRDDEHSQGSLSRLRAQIFNELRLQLGLNFKLWQDTEAIPEGTEWEGEITRAISESVFFIPIVTPSSVTSIHCRNEFEAFLDRERKLGRKNLVFPLLYVRVPALEKEELWRQDPLLGIIGRRQYFDWQKFRHRSFTEGEIAERIEQFCRNIVESLQQPWVSPEDSRAAEEAQRVAAQARRDQEEKDRQLAEAEARKAEQAHRTAAGAEVLRRAEVVRRAQEEMEQKAESERRAKDKAAAAREAEQERRRAEEDDRLKQHGGAPPQPAKKSWEKEIGLIGLPVFAACGIAGLIYIDQVLKPAPVAVKPAAPVAEKSAARQPAEEPGCMSWRTAAKGSNGKGVMIIFDDNPVTEADAQSAVVTARQNGYTVIKYERRGLDDVDGSSLLGQFKNTTVAPDLVVFCGHANSEFMNALKASKIFR